MKKCAIAGAGGRCYHTYAMTFAARFADSISLEGVYDINPLRSKFYADSIGGKLRAYDDFDEMLAAIRPDFVVVTTKDGVHHEYIVRALMAGCDVLTEKPIATDEAKCAAILEAERISGRRVTVTFNCRFMPYIAHIKELLNARVVGDILSVNYEYLLGTPHGSDYFRRWHRLMENSGSLLVHKSTHHFDICNWLLDDLPQTVTALGSLHYYGDKQSRPNHGKRCSDCEISRECEYYEPFDDEMSRKLYFEAESADGYHRDACPFDAEIDIYDNMSVSVRYRRGSILTYQLTTYNPYEAYKINITGTMGRLEAMEYFTGERAGESDYRIRIYDTKGKLTEHIFPKAAGAHSGGDDRMIDMLFGGAQDTLGQCAASRDGVAAAMIGICARRSIERGETINIEL